jgi:regulator of protease activity HflC (stomatin/prohibitin superfamily)
MVFVLFVIMISVSSIKIIKQATVGVVERLGKYHKTAEQGINVIIPFIDRFRSIIDLREQVVDFPPQPSSPKTIHHDDNTVVYYQLLIPLSFRMRSPTLF